MGCVPAITDGNTPSFAAGPDPSNSHSMEMCSGSEAGSYLRLIDSCITQRKAQGPSRTCNERKEGEEEATWQFYKAKSVRRFQTHRVEFPGAPGISKSAVWFWFRFGVHPSRASRLPG